MASSFILNIPVDGKIDFARGETAGMFIIAISMFLIFLSVYSHRKKAGFNGFPFGQGFRAGILTTLLASIVYISCWMIFYEFYGSQFVEQSKEYFVEQIQVDAQFSEEEKESYVEDFRKTMDSYQNNIFMRIFYTFQKIFPLGFLITMLSALFLRKKGTTNVAP